MTSGIGQILSPITSLVSNVACAMFPPLGIAMSAANLLQSALGSALGQLGNQLCQQLGMPKFVNDIIQNVIQNVLGQLPHPPNPECDHACANDFGHHIKDFAEGFAKNVFDILKSQVDDGGECSGAKGKSGQSWLVAIAKAMGAAAGTHAKKLVELSHQIDKASQARANSKDEKKQGEAADEVTKLQSEFQAESQMFSMLQNAFSNAIKSIGEGMTTMARKG